MTDITSRYHGGNPESQAAHDSIVGLKERQRALIITYAANKSSNGITCDEAEQATGLSHQSCSARISELKRDGLLLPTLFTRPTRSGRHARVLVLK